MIRTLLLVVTLCAAAIAAAFLLSKPAHALQPADVQITADPAVTVKVTPRKGNTSKTISIDVNAQDRVTVNGRQLYPTDHHAGLHVAPEATWPKGETGVDHPVFAQTWVEGPGVPGHWEQAVVPIQPAATPDNWEQGGDVRTVVSFVRMAFDDWIVYPGQPGMAHHHTFYGNSSAAPITPQNIRTSCKSTSRGGTMNCSAYWHPSMLDTLDGTPIRPTALLAYYKEGAARYMGRPVAGGVYGDTIQPFPAGLVMIAGEATRSTPGGVGRWTCMIPSQGMVARPGQENQPQIPACEPGDQLWLTIGFPQCWDGKNLDSPDHKSHMAYPVNDVPGLPPGRSFDCPATHPVLLPQVALIPHWVVPDKASFARWRLSSDTYTGPAGYSAHGDWMNGWDDDVMQTLWRNCWQARRNCGTFDLGDGRGAGTFGGND